jgi:hypothetical protein
MRGAAKRRHLGARLFKRTCAARANRHARAAGSKPQRDGAADATAATADNDTSSLYIDFHNLPQ